MADTAEFFSEYLPKKLADKPELRAAGGVYQRLAAGQFGAATPAPAEPLRSRHRPL